MKNHKNVMSMEGCVDNRGRNMFGSYTFITKYTAEDEFKFHGIPQRKK